ncbi:hypothetical protein AAH134_27360, partial [Bacteroides thetaiotaomicron]|uniref:hypothetical protein n=1 Tax=Bacteroides thetaiotaomicron TaxID=818 RepID=UPI0039B58321
LSSFKFSTKVWERNMLVNTPILDGYSSSASLKDLAFLSYLHIRTKVHRETDTVLKRCKSNTI